MPTDKLARIAQLRAEIAAVDAEQAARRERLLQLSREAVAELAGLGESQRLQFIGQQSTLSTTKMEAHATPPLTKSARTSASMTRSKAPFSQALVLLGKSIPEWVTPARKKQGLTVEAVRSWVKKPDHGGRPVPRVWADRIETELGVQAIAANWPNGIRE